MVPPISWVTIMHNNNRKVKFTFRILKVSKYGFEPRLPGVDFIKSLKIVFKISTYFGVYYFGVLTATIFGV